MEQHRIDVALLQKVPPPEGTRLKTWPDAAAPDGWRYATVFHRLEAYDLNVVGPFREGEQPLANCPCRSADCQHVNTYRHGRASDAVPYQLDFVLATSALGPPTQCFALNDEASWKHSDHCPVIAIWR